MQKRTAAIGLFMSLMPLGQPLVIKTGVALTASGVIFSIAGEANAESAVFYYDRGLDKFNAGSKPTHLNILASHCIEYDLWGCIHKIKIIKLKYF